MMERTSARERDREAAANNYYEAVFDTMAKRRDRAHSGRIVIKGSEVPWQQSRQGRMGYYLHDEIRDTALADWRVFLHDISNHSGRHIHQGGLGLYVLKGKGHTVVDGVKEEWEEGDLIVLPVRHGGVEHQHWNDDPNESSMFMAFIFAPWQYATGAIFEQREESPNWKG